MSKRVFSIPLCIALGLTALVRTVEAQEPTILVSPSSEETEPRIVGAKGTTMVGVSGFVDRFSSSRTLYPTNIIVQGDLSRFLTANIAVTGGLTGVARVGDPADAQQIGRGALAVHAFGGASYYLTPLSLGSLYLGGTYWNQVSAREGRDAGTVIGHVGLQAAVSARAAFYVEGGYGLSLAKGEKDETITRILGRVGVRFRF